MGTLIGDGAGSTHEALIALTCVNVFLCAHRYMSSFCPCAGFFRQTLTCAKGFGPSTLGTVQGLLSHKQPLPPPDQRPDPPRPETGPLLAFNASAEGLNQQASAEQSHQLQKNNWQSLADTLKQTGSHFTLQSL